MQVKGRLMICDRCKIECFAKISEDVLYEAIPGWHSISAYNDLETQTSKLLDLCPCCFESFVETNHEWFNSYGNGIKLKKKDEDAND